MNTSSKENILVCKYCGSEDAVHRIELVVGNDEAHEERKDLGYVCMECCPRIRRVLYELKKSMH